MPFKHGYEFREFCELVEQEYRYLHKRKSQKFFNAVKKTMHERMTDYPAGTTFWRAQLGGIPAKNAFVGSLPHPAERMKPNRESARSGRANSHGIPHLYLSYNKETAMSEIRPWKGADISCAKFQTVRDLKIVDCSLKALGIFNFTKAVKNGEYIKCVWADIDRTFSRPVSPDDEPIKYVPTQILAEFFKSEGIDGVCYQSALGDGCNVVLFDLDAAECVECKSYTAASINYDFKPGAYGCY